MVMISPMMWRSQFHEQAEVRRDSGGASRRNEHRRGLFLDNRRAFYHLARAQAFAPEHRGVDVAAAVEIYRPGSVASRLPGCARANAWQLDRRVQTEGSDAQIDQLDRLALEK